MSQRGIELQLPDLPEVPIALGPVASSAEGVEVRRPARAWMARAGDGLVGSLPLLLMGVLALGTWWLSRQAVGPSSVQRPAALRTAPDYTMSGFNLQRFGSDGQMRLHLEGQTMRHLPTQAAIEVDAANLRAIGPDGRETRARADRLWTDDRGEQIVLSGRARVDSLSGSGEPMSIEGESVRLHPKTDRVEADRPATLRLGPQRLDVGGLTYDSKSGQAVLMPPIRGVFLPPAGVTPQPR
jgi:lipopolysaccharide export system protein LptC